MLIECPDCKKQISDKADNCPNCGFPINQINKDNYCTINNTSYNLKEILDVLPNIGENSNQIHPYYIIGMIRDRTPLDPVSSQNLANIILETQKIPKEFNGTVEVQIPSTQKPHCPTCGSTNIEKIGGLERGASVAMLGLFSKKINKSFKCKNCGYTW